MLGEASDLQQRLRLAADVRNLLHVLDRHVLDGRVRLTHRVNS
jgi:hypothetical protein